MNRRIICSRILNVVGLAAMLVGAIDPLEGSFIILPGVAAVALAALIGKSRHTIQLSWSFALVAIGVVAMFLLSWLGGIGGNSGRSVWWAVVLLPYPIGWLMGLVGALRSLVESWNNRALQPPQQLSRPWPKSRTR
jgi:hypothetical protein